ncbi:hypothetical protein [Pimelobacter simplex]|uniref:hypothetical protein n=1 Tax=Nocardioides simplex TaxID=2045 RepID=UPI003AACDAFB
MRQGTLAAVCVALCLPIAYGGRWDQWLGVWSETQKHIGTAFIFAMPVAAAIGAFVGATTARNGMDAMRQVAGRRQVQVQARPLLELSAWVGLGYLAGTAPALIATAFTAEYGLPRLAPFVAQVACVAAVSALGQAAGSRLPWYLGAPICAAAVYLVLGFLSFNADSILVSLTPIDERRVTFEPIYSWVLLVQALFWLAVALHLLLRRSGLRRRASAALIAAGLAASPLLYVTPDTRGVDESAARQRCEAISPARVSRPAPEASDSVSAMTLCLPRGKEVVRGQLSPELASAARLLAGLLPSSVTFLDDEAADISAQINRDLAATDERERGRGAEVVRLSQAGDISAYTRIDTEQVHYGLIAYFVPPPSSSPVPAQEAGEAPDGEDLRPLATPTDVLWRWYLGEVGARIDGSGQFGGPVLDSRFLNYDGHEADLAFIADLSDADRAAWFERHAGSIRTGSLAWTDFRNAE